jgi:hypothetical protein
MIPLLLLLLSCVAEDIPPGDILFNAAMQVLVKDRTAAKQDSDFLFDSVKKLYNPLRKTGILLI